MLISASKEPSSAAVEDTSFAAGDGILLIIALQYVRTSGQLAIERQSKTGRPYLSFDNDRGRFVRLQLSICRLQQFFILGHRIFLCLTDSV